MGEEAVVALGGGEADSFVWGGNANAEVYFSFFFFLLFLTFSYCFFFG